MEQSVDEGVFLMAGGGMHDEPGGFVDDEEGLVLEEDFQRDFLGLRLGGAGVGPMDFHLLAGPGRVGGLDHVTVYANVALFDQPLQGAAGDGGEFFAQKNVQPSAGQGLLDGKTFSAVGHAMNFRDSHYDSLVAEWDSSRQLSRKISATPVQMAESATLKAGKSKTSRDPRRAM